MSGFWKFTSNYASRVTKILEQPDFTLEDLLDEQETIPELLASNAKLVEYLREPEVMEKLVDYIVDDDKYQRELEMEGDTEAKEETDAPENETESKEDEPEQEESEHEHESDSESDSDSDSVEKDDGKDDNQLGDDDTESFGEINMDDEEEEEEEEEETPAERHSRRAQVAAEILSVDVWSLTDAFMETPHLIEKLWSILDKPAPLPIFLATYFMKINEHLLDMKMDEMIQFILQDSHLIERFMRHIDTPPLMDFLLKVISTDKPDSSTGVIEVMKDQDLIPSLIRFLGPDVPSSTQSAAGDFLKAFITISANNAENTTIGPNELSRQLVSEPMVRELAKQMLCGGTGLSNGVGIVIEIIRKNNSDYDAIPVVYITIESHPPTPRDPIYLGTLVKVFAEYMAQFTEMLERKVDKVLETPFGQIEPLGFERFKICELVAELIHCSNMALLNHEKGEEIVRERDLAREILIQKEKELRNSEDQGSDDEVDISREVQNLNLGVSENDDEKDEPHETNYDEMNEESRFDENEETLNPDDYDENEQLLRNNPVVGDQLKIALYDNNVIVTILQMFFKFPWNNFLHNVVFDIVQQILNASMDIGYNKYLAIDLFDRGNITKLIIDGHNKCLDYEEQTDLRLGYMGHLTLIAEEVVKFTSLHLPSGKASVIEESVMNPEWTHYVNEILVETRNKYNAVLGNDEELDEEDYPQHHQLHLDPSQDHDLSLYQRDYDIDAEDLDEKNEEQELDSDQFSRYITQQMTSNVQDKFGSSDEDSEDEDGQQTGSDSVYDKNLVSSSIGGHPYHQMSADEGPVQDDDEYDEDDYEDPNDDGQSYVKENHPLYQADGSLNYQIGTPGVSELAMSDSDSDNEDLIGQGHDNEVDDSDYAETHRLGRSTSRFE
ncbi:hypothetical protein KL918_002299 [Ogataea parapolymorpha]|uniref:Protein that forms a complex with the Sit4p protein phosphatase and is required for its function n=1 Tax=Ogataea parapolymorpha (strain ATCC 26012 / BCRC 20466 / JCM 22074 / NRRL Y-7560 / DL-1) TaxID=871575 RepID=W1QKV0_OGAPD|nr:Protein that forms a complex with the Sit4p protein phosphatase and is required for its function [Ogataea parapolymorpha DL-1]ESX02926.1 Protein that forms a complex with the Sit4p protein phosphatase and is required for its function [Ogataea parapolymorpha DL-1]KAG7867702.1 hypothetical protein KL918_002299 [Ogataea parapolymorpha]KAG7869764.1 hypothetical protein KL916_005109 [Ogataea parapolymorpha]